MARSPLLATPLVATFLVATIFVAAFLAALLWPVPLLAQSLGAIEGQVVLNEGGEPLHGAFVTIVELGRSALTDDEGRYRFDDVPAGTYQLESHLDSIFSESTKHVVVQAGAEVTADFQLALLAIKSAITVTAETEHKTGLETFQAVTSLDSFDLASTPTPSLGEALDRMVGSGVAKRSFGPGSSRPIIRGFDGDRVLIMQDGIRTGTLSSQSGDHGEVLNTAQLDRIEIVKGPATLLYGTNAMGGTVNAISRHHDLHQHPHQGVRGFVSGSAGTANRLGGSNAGFEYGHGNWMIWGSGGGTRTGDYDTPRGPVFSSRAKTLNGRGGVGWYGPRTFVSFEIQADDGIYGVPFAHEFEGAGAADETGVEETVNEGEAGDIERIMIDTRRDAYQFGWGVKNLGPAIEDFSLKLNLTDWNHQEVELFQGGATEVATEFNQRQFVYRGVFEQKKRGVLTGRFGFWGLRRDFDVAGEETLAPPVDQQAIAAFGLEELSFERVKLQFGGRLERNRYQPGLFPNPQAAGGDGAPGRLPERSFTSLSVAAGIHADLWRDGAVVVNYAHTNRAPALEELYNNGPHIGNLAFEIGDPSLRTETGNGIDLSIRHQSRRYRAEVNLFYYSFDNFVFPFLTGEIEGGLRVVEFTQLDARFAGGEAKVNLGLWRDIRLKLAVDFVDAQETNLHTPLPRIPPLRGKAGLDIRHGNFSIEPELILANQQGQLFTAETRTPGYTVMHLKASYTIPQQHLAHQFSVDVFNIGDRLYRNHSSFIKDLAPEIGRGVRFSYMVRVF